MPRQVKILIISLKQIGDVVTTTPLIPIFKDNFPSCAIHYVVYAAHAPLVESHPDVSKVHTFANGQGLGAYWRLFRALRRERYDYVLDLSEHGRGMKISLLSGGRMEIAYKSHKFRPLRSAVPDVLLPTRWYEADRPITDCHADFARVMGCAFDSVPLPRVYPTEKGLEEAPRLLERLGVAGPYVVAHLTAREDARIWPPERSAEAVSWLTENVGPTLIISNGSEKDMRVIDKILSLASGRALSTGPLDLGTLTALLGKAQLFFGMDSMGGHVAAAAGCPVLSVFGPARVKHWAPRGPIVKIARLERPCPPCVFGGCLGGGLSACLAGLDFASDVRPKLEELLEEAGLQAAGA